MRLMKKEELLEALQIEEKKFTKYLKADMPHLNMYEEYRFIEEEVNVWIEHYKTEQEKHEREFVDKKGRTIASYVETEEILEILRITEEKLKEFCEKGMPFAQVGRHPFFQIEDIVEHFHRGEKVIPSPPTEPIKEVIKSEKGSKHKIKNRTLFVVDGSYHDLIKQFGMGVVMFQDGVTKGYSFGYEVNTNKSQFGEYFAILHALEIIEKENIPHATIYTDQLDLAESYNEGKLETVKLFRNASFRPYSVKMFSLLKKLEGKIRISYINKLPRIHQNTMYKNAHILSRRYKNEIIENIDLSTKNLEEKKVEVGTTTLPLTVQPVRNDVLEVSYERKTKLHYHYQLYAFGKKKQKAFPSSNPLLAALYIAVDQIKDKQNQSKKQIVIHSIPNFISCMNQIFKGKKPSLIKKALYLFDFLENNSHFEMKDDYKTYLMKHFESKEITIVA